MLPVLPYDKAMHIAYGAALSIPGVLVAHHLSLPLWAGALALPVLFGVGKEVYDRVSKRGTPDFMDAVATVAGALPAVIVGAL